MTSPVIEDSICFEFKLTNKAMEKSERRQTIHFETTIDFSRMNFLNLVDSRKSGTMYLDVMVTEIGPGMKGFTGGGFLVSDPGYNPPEEK
jgi:hypothetical protein